MYNSFTLGKAKMTATPTGKTVRTSRKVVNTKMYVDLSGYIEEASIYNGFHYYISAVTAQGYSYFWDLRLRSQALMGLAKIFNESGVPHTVQIDGEDALANDVAADWFASKQIHVVKAEAILVSASKEIDQIIEQQIGVEVTPAEVKQVTEKGLRILQCKMVYKRKYHITVAFSAIRSLISLTVDPKYSVESYDLSGAFLGTELRDRAVYIRLPRDAGIHAGKILLLKKSVYGLKTSGRDFIAQL
jgi:hypothetical protein